jgi:hypothetical protein
MHAQKSVEGSAERKKNRIAEYLPGKTDHTPLCQEARHRTHGNLTKRGKLFARSQTIVAHLLSI